MEQEVTHENTFVINGSIVDISRRLLSDGWRKRKAQVFFKERNNYILEFSGESAPLWSLHIKQKTNEFDHNDWKLRSDLKRLKNIDKDGGERKRLYVNDKNKREILALISAMKQNSFNLIFNDNYIVFRTKQNRLKIFKVAAAMDLVEQPDGWYVGQKRIL